MNVYVGNLNYDLSEDDLKQAFEEFGEVTSATVSYTHLTLPTNREV